jgi:hypothetical protein
VRSRLLVVDLQCQSVLGVKEVGKVVFEVMLVVEIMVGVVEVMA